MQQKFQSLLVGGLATLLHYLLLIALVQLAYPVPLGRQHHRFHPECSAQLFAQPALHLPLQPGTPPALPRFAITALLDWR